MRTHVLMIGALLVWVSAPHDALAVSQRVKDACRDDYLKHCRQHEVGSEALRGCMTDAFDKLSDPCVSAILDSELQKEQAQQAAALEHKSARGHRTAESRHRKKHWTEHVRHGERVAQRFMKRVAMKVNRFLH